ncbi:hypothetical protein ACLMAL_34695 [Nocardia sp. CWNU-33]|uniref:hypothetical protein n=1 Tax=Nocardia sp. CWNU-33 TaxID=3392117 RepID=UPI00398F6F8B
MSWVAIRTAIADLLPGRGEQPARAGNEEPHPIRIEMPGRIARHLTGYSGDLGDTERLALQQGRQCDVAKATACTSPHCHMYTEHNWLPPKQSERALRPLIARHFGSTGTD